jgi:hypothetical protein
VPANDESAADAEPAPEPRHIPTYTPLFPAISVAIPSFQVRALRTEPNNDTGSEHESFQSSMDLLDNFVGIRAMGDFSRNMAVVTTRTASVSTPSTTTTTSESVNTLSTTTTTAPTSANVMETIDEEVDVLISQIE